MEENPPLEFPGDKKIKIKINIKIKIPLYNISSVQIKIQNNEYGIQKASSSDNIYTPILEGRIILVGIYNYCTVHFSSKNRWRRNDGIRRVNK